MSGSIGVIGTDGFVECVSAADITSGNYAASANVDDISASITTSGEDDYPILDFQIVVTGATAGDVIEIYRQNPDEADLDGTTGKKGDPITSFELEAGGSTKTKLGFPNHDPACKYYAKNTASGTINVQLKVRVRTKDYQS